jgi:hypothetical protein
MVGGDSANGTAKTHIMLPLLSTLREEREEVMSSAVEDPWEPKKQDSAPFDVGGGPPYDGNMEARLSKLEADVTEIKIDLAVLKATCATKCDLAEVKAETKAALAEAKTSIIMWVVSAIFLAQLLPALLKKFGI